jgi:hypothetical protein
MKVLLTIDYNRYLVSIEDAAKVMALLGKAERVSSRYDHDANASFWQFDNSPCSMIIEPAPAEIRPANA